MAIIGIDLGTTNSLACVWKDGHCVFIPNAQGHYITPSIVCITNDEQVLVGEAAKDCLITRPDATFSQFKRWMGTDYQVEVLGTCYRGEDLSALVIRKLIEDARVYLKEDIEEAIISVPAYFNDDQRWATKKAGELTGIKVERIINEPSAAALSVHIEDEQDASFLIVDFGGGTFDLSIVEAYGHIVEIIAISGDNHLGGKDIDECIRDAFLEAQHRTWEQFDLTAKAQIMAELEQMKKRLSVEEEVTIELQLMRKKPSPMMERYQWTLDRTLLMNICAPVLMRMKQPLQRVLKDAKRNIETIDEIVLVGGTCHMPIVVDYLSFLMRREIHVHHNPDQVIAYGCGIAAGIKERKQDIKDYMLSDICPFTLGIEVRGEYYTLMSPIIERNTTLPCSHREFYTYRSTNGEVNLNILQGEHRKASENLMMKSIKLNLPATTSDEERPIAIRFTYDINGILDVEVETGPAQIHTHLIVESHTHRMTKEESAKRLRELDKLKLPAHEQEKNLQLIMQGERLYQEALLSQRGYISELLHEFENVLLENDAHQISDLYRKVKKAFDAMDSQSESTTRYH